MIKWLDGELDKNDTYDVDVCDYVLLCGREDCISFYNAFKNNMTDNLKDILVDIFISTDDNKMANSLLVYPDFLYNRHGQWNVIFKGNDLSAIIEVLK